MADHPYQKFHSEIKPFLISKHEEFLLLGIQETAPDEIWQCLTSKKWRKPVEEIHVYQLAADIISLSASEFMTYKTIQAYKLPELTEEEMKELFR